MVMLTRPERPGTARANAPHAVVIGSGFGGLAAAVRLGARGYRVTVLERLDAPGGRAMVHRQDGFTFDAGPTIITAPFVLEELWSLCGKRLSDDVELRSLEPFYTLRFADGSTFAAGADRARVRAEIERLSPGESAGYDRFMARSEELCRIGFEQLGHKHFGSIADMLRVVPDLIRLSAWRSVHALAASCFRDERLRIAFSFHPLLIGGNPFQASALYGLISHLEARWGVHWAMGGTGRLVQGLLGLIRSQGGTLRLNADVAEITVANGRATGVRLTSGETIAADIIVSNADSATTYGKLLSPAHRRRRWTDAKLDRARYSMSLFVWYFGTRRRYDAVPHHTILLGPRYRELLHDIFTAKVLADDFSLYLHRPTATDPAMAPDGCDAFYVLSPVPNLRSGIDWATQAEPYRRRISAFLERTLLPGLEANIVTQRIMTPFDFRDRLLSPHGCAFGLEPVLFQSAWFRPHNRSEEVERLFLVGAGTHPGAGIPGVISSAKVLDEVVPHADALA
jgi:phytoene desaturase